MEITSYILSALGLAAMISASLIKGEQIKKTLFFVFCGNFLVATSYLLDSGINGAASCYLGAAQSIINYFFDSKNKPIPKWLNICYALSFIAVNIIVAGGVAGLGLLAIVASLIFVLCIGQKNGKMYRFWTIVNMLLWCTYDVLSKSNAALMMHVSLLVFTVIGMIIHDLKAENKNKDEIL